jgi:hypothetical protein
MHMTSHIQKPLRAVFFASALGAASAFGQASPFRGLWVGSVSLRAVNEVAIPLDENNVPIAPKPLVPTPTFDEANLRILIHVNGAGQAFLLKDVAILNRVAPSGVANPDVFARESDLALVTDPRVYSEFPPQPAQRIASAVFDFGDATATAALDALVDKAVEVATTFATDAGLNASTSALRAQAIQAAAAQIVAAAQPIADNADVAAAFADFIALFNVAKLNLIAANSADPVVADLILAGETLRDRSFYADTRGMDMVNAVVAAVDAAPPADKVVAAYNTASSFADVQNLSQRFISGKTFGDMIVAAATASGAEAKVVGATAASIAGELRVIPASAAALAAALNARVTMYDDTRSLAAVNAVLAAIGQSAFDNRTLTESEIQALAEAAGRTALSASVARYPLPLGTPTLDYNTLVRSPLYEGAVQKAATAAATAAVTERGTNPLYSTLSVSGAARVAAVNALRTEYAEAARAQRTELPLAGTFGPGSGDPRPVFGLTQASDLGPAGLSGRIVLPASHPTNPFRHRRHPDHTVGFNIERVIRLDFNGASGDAATPAGYGVDKVTGTYREEIFGLHKPLGPEPETNPIGLKTEGTFELNRISFIDTLNTR